MHNEFGGVRVEDVRSVLHRRLATTPAPTAVIVSIFPIGEILEIDPRRSFLRDVKLVPRVCDLHSRNLVTIETSGRVWFSISNRAQTCSSIFDRFGESLSQGRGVV